jgi:hypothetical protein
MVAVQNIYVDENCQVVVEPVQFVDPADLPSGPEGLDTAVFSAESATARGARDVAADGGVSTEASDAGGGGGSGCCWKAYSVQRTWDCCNLLLNEYWMELQYQHCTNICSSYIRTYNAVDGGKVEGPILVPQQFGSLPQKDRRRPLLHVGNVRGSPRLQLQRAFRLDWNVFLQLIHDPDPGQRDGRMGL